MNQIPSLAALGNGKIPGQERGNLCDFGQVAALFASSVASANWDASISHIYSEDQITDVKCVFKNQRCLRNTS